MNTTANNYIQQYNVWKKCTNYNIVDYETRWLQFLRIEFGISAKMYNKAWDVVAADSNGDSIYNRAVDLCIKWLQYKEDFGKLLNEK